MDTSSAIEVAVGRLREGLAADGFDLRVGGVGHDGTVEVVLEAKPQACLDCLVSDEMLVSMLTDSMRRAGCDAERVTLVKKGFQQ